MVQARARATGRTVSRPPSSTALSASLVASGQIKLRRMDGWAKIAEVLGQHTAAA
jgi:hypothetical protein